jgi:regulatory protein
VVACNDAPLETASFSFEVEQAREICLRQLHGRAYTTGELLAVMRRKQISEEASQEALERLAAVGLVDDARYARDWVARHGSGKARWILQRELIRKGIDPAVIQELMEGTSEPAGIEKSVVARRWASLRSLPEDVQVRRAAALLARRGFDPARASDVVEQLRLGEDVTAIKRC